MKIYTFLSLIIIGFCGISQNSTYTDFINELESDIVFNEYLTDEERISQIEALVIEAEKKDFDSKDLFLKYADVNKIYTKGELDEALYKFVEITEICDTTIKTELRIYLGSLLQISSVLRENSAYELSYQYVRKGINIIERIEFSNYPWIQDFYNDAGVDLLSMGDYDNSLVALKKALTYNGTEDYLQDAMIEYNLSFFYYELNKLDSAIFHQKNVCDYLKKITKLNAYPELYDRYGNALGSLAIFYFSNGNIDLAEESALHAQKVFNEIDVYNSGRYPHLYTLMQITIEKGNKEQIDSLLFEIDKVAEKIEEGRYNFYELLSMAYSLIDDSNKENDYLNRAYSQFQTENSSIISKLQKYNTKLQTQILKWEKNRFQNEKNELKRRALQNTMIVSLISISLLAILYILYIRTRNKKNLLEKEKKISKIELEKNEIKSKLTESELNEKRLIANRLASHIKLKQQTETAFLQKIKELKRSKAENIEAEISELQVKMINLINIDQNFDHSIEVNDLNQEFRGKLKIKHPELSEKELQFCTYLLLNLSAKEIGSITNQSDGAIRVYKNRLKKKLVGNTDVDLLDYLQNI